MNDPEFLQSAIIGALITWPGEIDEVALTLQPSDFQSQKHRAVYEWLLGNRGFDFVTVTHAMRGQVPAYELAAWSGIDCTSLYLPRYCKDLKDESNKIRLHNLATDVRLMCQQGNNTYPEIRDKIESTLAQMSTDPQRSTMRTAKELVHACSVRVEKRHECKGQLSGIPYGWSDLDLKTNGMNRGDLIIVAGRPSMGKTAFALNILESVTGAGQRGVLFSLEMGHDQVMDRIASSVGRVRFANIRSGKLDDHEWSRFHTACERLYQHTINIDDTPRLSLAELKAKARKLKADGGLDLLVLDYLQLMKLPSKDNRVQAIGEISRGLKLLARELDIVVMALSQLSRAVDSRPDKRPTMSDLRDSGEIEQDADVILFPFRPAAYCEKCRDRRDDETHNTAKHQMVAELIIEKQRNGERNISIPLIWRGDFQRFEQRVV